TDYSGASNALQYLFSERMISTLIAGYQGTAPQRNDADARLLLVAPLVSGFSLTSLSTASGITDNQDIGINHTLRFGSMAGPSGTIADGVHVAALGGWTSDSQIGRKDTGPQYSVQAQLMPTQAGDYVLSGVAMSSQEYIAPRRNATDDAQANADIGTQQTSLHAHAEAMHTERDFYFSDSISQPFTGQLFNIQERKEDNVNGSLVTDYTPADGLRFQFDAATGNRTIMFHDAYKTIALPNSHIDTRINQFNVSGAISAGIMLFGSDLNVRMRYEEFDETHGVIGAPENTPGALQQQSGIEAQKNSVARRTQISEDLSIPVGKDSLIIASTFGVLHYDTPDTNNNDDRDELDAAIHVSYQMRYSTFWLWGMNADMFLHHLVYLFAEESGNNSWNRIIRFAPFIIISPAASVRSRASFEVLGNYTVFDFQPLLTSVKSYAYRQIDLHDSTAVDITPTLRISAYGDLRWYEHGILDWDAFSERPIDRVREWTYGVILQKQFLPALTLSAGVHVFTRFTSEYSGAGLYTPPQTLKTLGPDAALQWQVNRWGVLQFNGWYEFILDGNLPAQIIPNMNMSVAWNL
ncbi:MAG TPA: hypothetical protein VFJ29_02915, partial [Candidatus Kapabacteria bacterium]|nr:hypothetical protein [Candidatus Kapabacteria bacterium]